MSTLPRWANNKSYLHLALIYSRSFSEKCHQDNFLSSCKEQLASKLDKYISVSLGLRTHIILFRTLATMHIQDNQISLTMMQMGIYIHACTYNEISILY